jgi:EmrB/QacA subfamily drug resistance transporter
MLSARGALGLSTLAAMKGLLVTQASDTTISQEQASTGDPRLPILLAMAMFVLVVDTSIMNVSISAVVADLGTDVSAIQSAIALEALVSAAFILIGSKIGDLFGRKRAYIVGLLAYAVGALAMALSQSVVPIFIFWAIIGGLGASLLLPAMQSLIHGNFEGAAQKATYALVGAAAAIAAAVGPLIGGFITTFLSYRVAFGLEVVVIAIVLLGSRLVRDVPYTGPRQIDLVGALLSVLGMGGLVLGILVWQEGGEAVGLLLAIGAVSLALFAWWLVRRKREGKPTLIDPALFASKLFRFGISGQLLQNVALGGAMITIPIYLQMVLEYNALQSGLSLAPLSLSMFATAIVAGRRSGNRRPASIIRAGFALLLVGLLALIPIIPRADAGWYLAGPLVIAGIGLGLLVSQLNNYTLSPIVEERVSEAAGVNSAAGSFGLSFGLAFAGAIMLATLAFSFTNLAEQSTVLTPVQQQEVAAALEADAEVMTNTALDALIVNQTPEVEAEIIRINTEARPFALQVALLIPILASLLGLLVSFRMIRQPDPVSSGVEGLVLG